MTGGIAANPLRVAGLTALMRVVVGAPDITIGLIDGPVAADHSDLATESIRYLSPALTTPNNGFALAHGTYVAGILSARRGSSAPAICPGCTLLVRPIFFETAADLEMPSATPDEVADAVADCVDAGARVVNLSVAVASPSPNKEKKLEEALSYAAHRDAIVVAAAGNQGTIGSSAITRHVWVIPVAACNLHGQPIGPSNLGASIGRRGLRAPGEAVTSLGTRGEPVTSGGTSAAAPFVTGTVALLWSAFPTASATEIKRVVTRAGATPRNTIVPPLLDAWAAYQALTHSRGTTL